MVDHGIYVNTVCSKRDIFDNVTAYRICGAGPAGDFDGFKRPSAGNRHSRAGGSKWRSATDKIVGDLKVITTYSVINLNRNPFRVSNRNIIYCCCKVETIGVYCPIGCTAGQMYRRAI